jgi:hypothetical protein
MAAAWIILLWIDPKLVLYLPNLQAPKLVLYLPNLQALYLHTDQLSLAQYPQQSTTCLGFMSSHSQTTIYSKWDSSKQPKFQSFCMPTPGNYLSFYEFFCQFHANMAGSAVIISKWFCKIFTGSATGAVRCGSFMGNAFSLLIVSSR